MTAFQYKGRTSRGELVTGKVDADSADAAASQLFNVGITPIDIELRNEPDDVLAVLRTRLLAQKPGLDDLILFSRQMHALSKSGVPLVRGLNALAESIRNPLLGDTIREVVATLESGRDLASSLARHPAIFSPLYVSMVRVGESAGRLEEAFLQLYDYLQREKETRNRVKQALRYPLIVLGFIAAAIIVVTLWVIPAFANVFARFGSELPLPTQIILATSNFMLAWWPALLVTGIAALVFGNLWVRTERGRYRWDGFKLRLPVTGGIMLRASLARYARAFAMTIRSGVPLSQALTLLARAIGNEYLGERIVGMRNGVERGESLSRTSQAAGVFTPLVIQMLAVGEETGRVDTMLEEVADFYDREVDYDLRTLTDRITPILTVAMGVIVLILALGVFLPMWDMYKLIA